MLPIRRTILLATLLALASCASPKMKELEIAPDSPADLQKHVYEVTSGDSGNRRSRGIISELEPRGSVCPERQADNGTDSETVRLRDQFVCIIENAIDEYKRWTSLENGRGREITRLKSGSVLKLVFYFNGGLNSQKDILVTAKESYRQAENDKVYPIYMVWPTGGLDSYWEDVAHIRAGRRTKFYTPSTLATTPGRPVSDFIRGIASTPAVWATSLWEFYASGFGFGSNEYMMERDEALRVENNTISPQRNLYYANGRIDDGRIEADQVYRNGDAGAPIATAAEFAYSTAVSPMRAASTSLAGAGEAAYRNMLRRTQTSVRAANEYFEDKSPAQPIPRDGACNGMPRSLSEFHTCYPRGKGGFARFFQWLQSCISGHEIDPGAETCPLPPARRTEAADILRNTRIIMVGHSMGSIVVNELLKSFPDLPYEAIVFMGGAASIGDTKDIVSPILMNNKSCTKFYGLMLHPMNEAREFSAYGMLPSGSLLTYIDEFLTTPTTLADRTVGQWRNLRMALYQFPVEAREAMFLRVFDREAGPAPDDPEHLAWNPTTHGGFNDANIPFWRESFWKPQDISWPTSPAGFKCEPLFDRHLGLASSSSGMDEARKQTP